MNIKRAKQEIKDAIEAYLIKDAYGEHICHCCTSYVTSMEST